MKAANTTTTAADAWRFTLSIACALALLAAFLVLLHR